MSKFFKLITVEFYWKIYFVFIFFSFSRQPSGRLHAVIIFIKISSFLVNFAHPFSINCEIFPHYNSLEFRLKSSATKKNRQIFLNQDLFSISKGNFSSHVDKDNLFWSNRNMIEVVSSNNFLFGAMASNLTPSQLPKWFILIVASNSTDPMKCKFLSFWPLGQDL